jgi:uncharacterized protein (DUF952 family)
MAQTRAALSRDDTLVYKILTESAWRDAVRAGAFRGSADDHRDGFIHLSTARQLEGTLARHFRGQDGLLLVAFQARMLGPELRWEPSRGGELFPHLYGPLPAALALWTRALGACEDGMPRLPADLC